MSTKSAKSAKSVENRSTSNGLDDNVNANVNGNGVTPLGLAVAVIIICVLAVIAVPRLRAVSGERGRPEGPRVLESYESPSLPGAAVMFDTCGGVGVSRAGQ